MLAYRLPLIGFIQLNDAELFSLSVWSERRHPGWVRMVNVATKIQNAFEIKKMYAEKSGFGL